MFKSDQGPPTFFLSHVEQDSAKEVKSVKIKELTDKLAWAVGSTLALPYARRRCKIHQWAEKAAVTLYEAYVLSQKSDPAGLV